MQYKSVLICLMFLIGCGDNVDPNLTWGDAEMVWSEAWCGYAKRCQPELYADYFESDQACVDWVYTLNCEILDCTDDYPNDRYYDLMACRDDMGVVDCKAQQAPMSCFEAFQHETEEMSRVSTGDYGIITSAPTARNYE